MFILTQKPTSVLVLKHKDENGTGGKGKKGSAGATVVAKYNKVKGEVVHATMERLVSTSVKLDQDPDDPFMEKTVARS